MKTWNREQAKQYLAASESDRNHVLYVLALSTGMRQGEMLALRWSDVDLSRGTLSVAGNLQRPNSGMRLSADTKTRSGRRRITLTPEAVEALARHRDQQAEERQRLDGHWTDQGLIFPNHVGWLNSASRLKGHHTKLVQMAGLPYIRFHDLRHTCATILLAQGVNPKIVSEILGHSSIAITMDL
jgi:integrase